MSSLDFLILRARLRQYDYELVLRGKTVYIRRRPFVRDAPTDKMLAARGAMKLASTTGTGSRGFKDGIPVVAARNRVQIPVAMHFLKVTAPSKRVEIARQVAEECELTAEEKEALITLVS